MTADDYRRLGVLFDQLREIPDEKRTTALDAGCAGNAAELRAGVLRLLEADRAAADGLFLEQGAMEDAARLLTSDGPTPAPGETAGTVVGRYHLLEVIRRRRHGRGLARGPDRTRVRRRVRS